MKIFVCDDEPQSADDWVKEIQVVVGDANEVARINDPKLEIKELLERQSAIRNDVNRNEMPSVFDETDVLVVDYDLVHVDDKNARHTGEEFARLARLYSSCGYIIVVNQFDRETQFDLTLKGHPKSYGDVNVPATAVGLPALWSQAAQGEFYPWYWDDILSTLTHREELVEMLAQGDHLESSVLAFVGMPVEAAGRLSDTAYEFLDPSASDVEGLRRATFAEFLIRSTEHRDVERLLAKQRKRAAATAIARLSKWLSRMLLGPQDVLVDVPHLIQRMPFLLDPALGDLGDAATWDSAIAEGQEAICPEVRNDCSFVNAPLWMGRAAFWWSAIEAHPFVAEKRAVFDFTTMPDLVFAEDISRFVPFEEATEFRAGFHNLFDRRYVKRLEGNSYGPTRRFVFG